MLWYNRQVENNENIEIQNKLSLECHVRCITHLTRLHATIIKLTFKFNYKKKLLIYQTTVRPVNFQGFEKFGMNKKS